MNYQKLIHYAILILLIYLVVFLKLGSFNIRWWDESMFAVNTYEMMESGEYFSLSYNHHADLYNTKPPLTQWLQLLSVKLFGYNELAIRLPSALATALSILVLFRFTSRYFGFIMAWMAALILLTSTGFIGFHTGRTGDSDALLTLFVLGTNITFIQFVMQEKQRYILTFFGLMILAFSTKLYAAFLCIPAYLVILIYFRKTKSFILNSAFMLGVVSFLLLSIGLIYLREMETPGYIHKIFLNDAGRLFTALGVHTRTPLYYIDNLFTVRFSYWALFFMFGLVLMFKMEKGIKRDILWMIFLLCCSYLLTITLSKTKLEWYDMPLYPYLAIIAAFSMHYFLKLTVNEKQKIVTSYALVALISFYPFMISFGRSQANSIGLNERNAEANELYIFNAIKTHENLDEVRVLYHGWNGGLLFYKYRLKEQHQHIQLCTGVDGLNIGDKVLVSNDSLENVLKQFYNVEKVNGHHAATLYTVTQM